MLKCPRCDNEEINEGDNYCKICGLSLVVRTVHGDIDKETQLDILKYFMHKYPERFSQDGGKA